MEQISSCKFSEYSAQQSVQLTVGTRRVFQAFVWLWFFSRFDGESTLPPTAANAGRWAAQIECEFLV